MNSPRKNNKVGFAVIIIIVLCMMCCACIFIVFSFNDGGRVLSTPTSAPTQVFDTPPPIPTLIALTYSAARTQTAMANPAPLPTATLVPLLENNPTATIFIFQLQTDVAQPTEYIYSTNTPFTLATQPLQSAVCSCTGDTLNCGDFNTHSAAQACFNYCISQGAGDIHRLDGNNDGSACDSLP